MSSSTSLKSSVQRNIRGQLLEQMPLLTKPAYRQDGGEAKPEKTEEAPAPTPTPSEEPEDDKKGGKKGGKGKGGGKKGKKADKEPEPEAGEDDGELLLIDEIWPKKEALGLTKWWVTCWDDTPGRRAGLRFRLLVDRGI